MSTRASRRFNWPRHPIRLEDHGAVNKASLEEKLRAVSSAGHISYTDPCSAATANLELRECLRANLIAPLVKFL